MGVIFLIFVILSVLILIWGIINILAAGYNWTIILILGEWYIPPSDFAFGKRFIKDEARARKYCMIYGIILSILGAGSLLALLIFALIWHFEK
ncbi:MAG: hypothetical protein LBE91_07210 [Tannerella sp.]|jgi:hypothetical protein|nr:hypothetical protein [Tannerella sp.]